MKPKIKIPNSEEEFMKLYNAVPFVPFVHMVYRQVIYLPQNKEFENGTIISCSIAKINE